MVLHRDRDALGVRRLEAHIRFSELDSRTVNQTHQIIADRLTKTGTGRLVTPGDIDQAVTDRFERSNTIAHHIGTTRIFADPRDGVVNAEARVHDLQNLYIAGASIFPTSGHAIPTLTIAALSRRLADHLRRAARPTAYSSCQCTSV